MHLTRSRADSRSRGELSNGTDANAPPMNARAVARLLRAARPWRRGHASLLLAQVYHRRRNAGSGLTDHLEAAAAWLARAQDVTGDGGVCGRYSLTTGWSSSYPETTGYIVPTFLALAERLGREEFRERARRCIEFLLPLQLGGGGFPGLEIAENRTEPSPFNTAQIVHGLVAWHRATGDERALAAALRAGEWLLSVQDGDGAFRKYYYQGVAASYSAHASCWLAELGAHTGEDRFLRAAGRHVDWLLGHVDDETGWIDLAGFSAEDHRARRSVTHTLAYTIWGVLLNGEILGRDDAVAVAARTAERVGRRLELSRRLPGILDHRFRAAAEFVCLTGNAQMACIWERIFQRTRDLRLVNFAWKALDGVLAAQPLDTATPDLRGGIPGSDPVWGAYIPMAVPNWAAKYAIDAMLACERMRDAAKDLPPSQWTPPADVPRVLPPRVPTRAEPLRVVLYTSPHSDKPARILDACDALKPVAIVVEDRPAPPARDRLLARLRHDGAAPLLRRLQRKERMNDRHSPAARSPASLADHLAIPCLTFASLSAQEAIDAVRTLRPDLAVHAGAGIMRSGLLEIPRLGTLNAHMGLLPRYRGMHVPQWAALEGAACGCSVHLIDAGIDTGDVLCTRDVDTRDAHDIATLRQRIDDAQIRLLGEVLSWILASSGLPSRWQQAPDQGQQYFAMHPVLETILADRLRV